MIININDEFLIKSLSNDIKGLAIQEINKLLTREVIEKMANERFNNIFLRDCKRILQDGRFYNSLSKHLAMQMSDKIADEVLWQEGHLLVQLGLHYILTPIWETYHHKYVQTDRSEKHEVNADSVGQFTGLFDRNGKEIYEGDILNTKGNFKGVVKWHSDGYFYFKTLLYDEDEEPDVTPLGGLSAYKEKRFEIIGNIHDNSELIKD